MVDQLLHLGDALGPLPGQREAEVEREVAFVGGDVRELPAHTGLVGTQPLDRRPREADQGHVAVIQVDEPAVEAVREAAAARTRTVCVVRPEHDVVGEELRAAVEKLRKRLLPLLGVELVLLLDWHPGELEPPFLDLLVSLRLLGLEFRKLVPSRLPLLAGSDLVLRHLLLLLDPGRRRNRSTVGQTLVRSGIRPWPRAELIGADRT